MYELNIKDKTIDDRYLLIEEYNLCPECDAVMNQVDQLKEGRYIYTWFECSKSDCNGQWLKKERL